MLVTRPLTAFIVGLMMLANVGQADTENHVELHALPANDHYEPAVLSIIESVVSGQPEQALEQVNQHLAKFPVSRIGHLLRADILQGMSGPLLGIGAGSGLPDEALQGLRRQIDSRWQHAAMEQAVTHERFPSSLVHMGTHAYVLVADMPKSRLYLYANDNGMPRLVRDYYMSVGSAGYGKTQEGDNKTPIGVYEINHYIEGKRLPDLYGKGAFPVNYPNRYDRYRQRTGYGIWLHGTPSDTYARAPWSSEGCFVLSNDDLLDIDPYLSPEQRTPVILSDAIEWLDRTQLQQRRQELMSVTQQWEKDWERLDMDALLAHYAQQDFNFGQGDYTRWAQRKRQVHQTKTFVQLDVDIESLFAYPGEQDMFVVRYKQKYLSNDFSNESNKLQYWQRGSEGHWRIVFEGDI